MEDPTQHLHLGDGLCPIKAQDFTLDLQNVGVAGACVQNKWLLHGSTNNVPSNGLLRPCQYEEDEARDLGHVGIDNGLDVGHGDKGNIDFRPCLLGALSLWAKAVVWNAENINAWNAFAKDAAEAKEYSDIGKLLIRLSEMVSIAYLKRSWLENDFLKWKASCQIAKSAKCIEYLNMEFVNAILWNEVDAIWEGLKEANPPSESKNHKALFEVPVIREANNYSLHSSTPLQEVGLAPDHKEPQQGVNCVNEKQEKGNPGLESKEWKALVQPPVIREAHSSSLPSLCLQEEKLEMGLVSENKEPSLCQQAFLSGKQKNISIKRFKLEIRRRGLLHSSNFCQDLISENRIKTDSISCNGLDEHDDTLKSGRAEEEEQNKPRTSSTTVDDELDMDHSNCITESHGVFDINISSDLTAPVHSVSILPSKRPALDSEYCSAYIRRTKKQCTRSPSQGSHYCSRHIRRSLIQGIGKMPQYDQAKFVHTPDKIQEGKTQATSSKLDGIICAGITTYGRRCLHKARIGSSYCKKHSAPRLDDIVDEQSIPIAMDSLGSISGDNSVDNECRDNLPCIRVKDSAEKRPRCFGHRVDGAQCSHRAKPGTSYCEKHMPNTTLDKLHRVEHTIHETAYLRSNQWLNLCMESAGYKADRSIKRNTSQSELVNSILSEASNHMLGAETLLKLVSMQKDKMGRFLEMIQKSTNHSSSLLARDIGKLKCLLCGIAFPDNVGLGNHWRLLHSEETNCFMKSCICRLCNLEFTCKDVAEMHVKVEHSHRPECCLLAKCIACDRSFVSFEILWSHALSNHLDLLNSLPCLEVQTPKQESLNVVIPDVAKNCSSGVRTEKTKANNDRMKLQSLEDLGCHNKAEHTTCYGKYTPAKRNCADDQTSISTNSDSINNVLGNDDILAAAKSVCCEAQLYAVLSNNYMRLPRGLGLIAAKLSAEFDLGLKWTLDGYICKNHCKMSKEVEFTPSNQSGPFEDVTLEDPTKDNKVVTFEDVHDVKRSLKHVICEDISTGQEPIAVPCVVDEDMLPVDGSPLPWEQFKYVTKRLLDPELNLDTKNSQLGCSCQMELCTSDGCDHVQVFESDNVEACDIFGRSMRGRFPYNKDGQIIMQEGYLIYECNSCCHCSKNCQNRVLQKGVRAKLEVFKTKQKGWGVRAAEDISRGTFVCEYIGEVLNDHKANIRGERYDEVGCSYLYNIDGHLECETFQHENKQMPYVIDATHYGNVSRFINHSCRPNLVNYQVLVESVDCQLAHIGFFACTDIAVGEELAYDYRYKLLPGKGYPCHCGAIGCRKRLY